MAIDYELLYDFLPLMNGVCTAMLVLLLVQIGVFLCYTYPNYRMCLNVLEYILAFNGQISGGILLKLSDEEYDGSVCTQFDAMRSQFWGLRSVDTSRINEQLTRYLY